MAKLIISLILLGSLGGPVWKDCCAIFLGQNKTVSGGGGGGTAFAFVTNGVTACFSFSNTGTNCVTPIHSAPVAGHARYISTFWSDTGTQTITLVSSNGDNWVSMTPGKFAGFGGPGCCPGASAQRFYVLSSGGGSDTITMTISSGTTIFQGWETLEYSYTGTLSSLDGTPVMTQATSVANVVTTSAVTTTGTSDLLIGDCPVTPAICTSGVGWTARNDTNACKWDGTSCINGFDFDANTGMILEEKTGITAGSQTATFHTSNATDISIVGLVAF